jgi:hypothetical protein
MQSEGIQEQQGKKGVAMRQDSSNSSEWLNQEYVHNETPTCSRNSQQEITGAGNGSQPILKRQMSL